MAEGLRLLRKGNPIYCIRKFGVIVDDQKVGAIANGAEEVFQLTPGSHNVRIKVSWCKSKTVPIMVRPGETVNLECGVPLGATYFISMVVCALLIVFSKEMGAAGLVACLLAFGVAVYWLIQTFTEDKFVYLKDHNAIVKDS
jgi:hypothetical protein